MSRPSRQQMMMSIADTVSARGTCSRLYVGAVIAQGGRIVSMGYNGTPPGMDHCNHTLDETTPCDAAIHAEANAIVWAAREGIATEGATLYVTHMPCLRCAQLIISAGIVSVIYRHSYRLTDGIKLLVRAGVAVGKHGGWGYKL